MWACDWQNADFGSSHYLKGWTRKELLILSTYAAIMGVLLMVL